MATPPPAGVPAYTAPPAMANTMHDREGIGQLKVGSLLGLIVQALFWVGFLIFYLIFTAVQNTATSFGTTGTTLPSWITVNTFYAAVGLLAGGLIIGIIVYIFFFLGFRAIKRGDPEFGGPTTLMIIGLIGYLMVALGIVVLIGAVVDAINNAVATVSTGSTTIDIGAIVGAIGLIGLGAILALIGVIGLVLGNWRAGKRYDEGTIRIGAILTILPYVSLVGYILLLVGYMRAGNKIASGWVPQSRWMQAPPPGSMPPPGYMPPPGQQPPNWQAPPPSQ